MIKINEMTRTQKATALVAIFVIVLSSFVLIRYHEKIFVQEIKVQYPDGCVEIFKNGVATTPLCIQGRALMENKSIGYGGSPFVEPIKLPFEENNTKPNINIG